MERSLVLLKPDAVQRGLCGKIITKLEDRGLKIAAIKMVLMDDTVSREHYSQHVDKPFFKGLSAFMTSRPIIALVIEGDGVIDLVRSTVGATNPSDALPGTIRGDYGIDIGRNLIHASDSVEAGGREVRIFFPEEEVHSYDREIDRWVTES
jgi:nucleoside-diphosphate kinase